ncbi:hypothetical protein Plhal304r1_c060g0146581 [Plasmopara halstedii]
MFANDMKSANVVAEKEAKVTHSFEYHMIVIYTWASSSRLYHSTKRKVSYNLTWAYTLTFRSLAEEQLVALNRIFFHLKCQAKVSCIYHSPAR